MVHPGVLREIIVADKAFDSSRRLSAMMTGRSLWLDRPEFVSQVASTLTVSDFDRWAAPLGRLARDTLIQDLQARLPAGKVMAPNAGPAAAEVRVEATVLSFTATGGEAVMSFSYRLSRVSDTAGKPVDAPPRPLSLRTSLAADDPASQARAWSVLLGQLADRIASDVGSPRAS